MEEMTWERLHAYRNNQEEIRELKYKLQHLGEGDSLIRNDVVFNYRNGFPKPESVVGYNYELEAKRRRRYKDQIAKLEAEQDNIEEYVFGIRDSRTRRIFQLYFLEGLTQEQVGAQTHTERSGVSKCIGRYLKKTSRKTKVSHKSQKSHV